MKILVVDDDELIRALLVEILDAYGFSDIVEAEDGEDALSKIAAAPSPFDCFMFDIQMPGMDGIELCSKVRTQALYEDTPVIMITAMNQNDYINRAFGAGATDYVTKPFDTTELMTRVKLAEKLQAETRKARELLVASSQTQSAPQVAEKRAYSEPVNLSEIHGFVSGPILENYAKINIAEKTMPLGAVALRIPELDLVHAGSTDEEYVYVLLDIAEVLSEALVGAQAFMTYVGNGTFLCVGHRQRMPEPEALRENLVVTLNDPDLVYCDQVQTAFNVAVGPMESPKMLERKDNLGFLDRAIDMLTTAMAASTDHKSNRFSGRLWQRAAA